MTCMTIYPSNTCSNLTHMDCVIKGPQIGYTHKFKTFRQYLILMYMYVYTYTYIHMNVCMLRIGYRQEKIIKKTIFIICESRKDD